MVEHALMSDTVELVGGDPRRNRCGCGFHCLGRDASGDAHLLDRLGVLDLWPGVLRGRWPIDILRAGNGRRHVATSAEGSRRHACVGDRHTLESRQGMRSALTRMTPTIDPNER